MDEHRIPISFGGILGGLAVAQGFMTVSSEKLGFEYQVEDSVVGALRGPVRRRTVRYADLEEVDFSKGVFSSRLVFRAKNMRAFSKFPQRDRTSLEVVVAREHRRAIKAALDDIELYRGYAEADRLLDNKKQLKPRSKRG